MPPISPATELQPRQGLTSDQDMLTFKGEKAGLDMPEWHAAVVDPPLRFNGVRHLRVVDASIMARIVSRQHPSVR